MSETLLPLERPEDSYRAILDSLPELICTFRPDGELAFVNGAYAASWGKSPRDLVGTSYFDVLPEEARGAMELQLLRLTPEEPLIVVEHEVVTPDGDPGWQRWYVRAIYDDEGEITELQSVGQDITSERQAQAALRRREREFRTLANNVPDIIARFDSELGCLYMNRRVEELTGHPVSHFVGRRMTSADVPGGVLPTWEAAALEVLETGEPRTFEYTFDPGDRPVHHEARIIREPEGEAGRHTLLVIDRDITVRRRAEDQMVHQSERLQALSRRLVEVQEAERRHIARELHDQIGQALTGIKFALESAQAHEIRVGGTDMCIGELCSELMDRVRDLSLQLRPAMLDELGLMPALEWQIGRFSSQAGISVQLDATGIDGRLAPDVEVAAFRIVQEALTNVARHADAAEATVALQAAGGQLAIRIQDGGCGFALDTQDASNWRAGMDGMRERASLLGGRFDVRTAPGEGTTVSVVLPLQP